MSNVNYKLFDAINDLEFAIKSHHCVTSLIASSSEAHHIDLENLHALLSGIGDKLQIHFTELEKAAKTISA